MSFDRQKKQQIGDLTDMPSIKLNCKLRFWNFSTFFLVQRWLNYKTLNSKGARLFDSDSPQCNSEYVQIVKLLLSNKYILKITITMNKIVFHTFYTRNEMMMTILMLFRSQELVILLKM